MRFWTGPFQKTAPLSSASLARRSPPAGATWWNDLSPLPECASTAARSGVGLFITPDAVLLDSLEYDQIIQGDWTTAITAAVRNRFGQNVGVGNGALAGNTVLQMFESLYVSASDPEGLTAVRPLMPDLAGLTVFLSDGLSHSQVFSLNNAQLAAKVIANLKHDYRIIRQDSINGKMRGPFGIDPQFHRRWLGWLCDRYGVDKASVKSAAIPADLPQEDPLPHFTRYDESFNQPDGRFPGPDLTWTEVANGADPTATVTVMTVSNELTLHRAGTGFGESHIRAEHDLSGTDAIVTATIRAITPFAILGLSARYSSSADTCYTFQATAFTTNVTDRQFDSHKWVAGVETDLSGVHAQDPAVTDVMQFEMIGSSFVGKVNATQLISFTDTAITTGNRAGARLGHDGDVGVDAFSYFDSWSGPTTQGTRTTGGADSNATSFSITLPSGITAGELLVVYVASDGVPTLSVNTGVSGPNWNALTQQNETGTSATTGRIFWKIAAGSDVLTLTASSTEQISYVSVRYANAVSVTTTAAQGSSTNSNPPSHTPPNGARDYLWVAVRCGDAQVQATVAPTNYTNLTTRTAGTSTGASIAIAERQLNASSEDPGTFTSATEQWVAFTVAIQPAIASRVSVVEVVSGTSDSTDGTLPVVSVMAESAAATDALTVIAAFTPSQAESAAASDAPTVTAIFTPSQAESAAATDSRSAAATFASSQAESAASSDANSAVWTTAPAQAESSAATDSHSAAYQTPGTQAETAAASDAVAVTSMTFASSEDEGLSIADAVDAVATMTVLRSESAVAGDSHSAVVSADRAVSESAAATDARSVQAAMVGAQDESAASADAQTVQTQFVSSGADSAGVSDAQSVERVQPATGTDSASSSDLSSATVTIPASENETTAIADTSGVQGQQDASQAESVAGAEVQSAIAQFVSSGADTLAASDTQDFALTQTASQSDTQAATDQHSATADDAASQNETIASSDETRISGVYADLADSMTATDSRSASVLFQGLQVESASIQDVLDAVFTYFRIEEEGLHSDDTYTLIAVAVTFIGDILTVSDQRTVTADVLADCHDALSAIDASFAAFRYDKAVAESAAPQDSYLAGFATTKEQSEFIHITDLIRALLFYVPLSGHVHMADTRYRLHVAEPRVRLHTAETRLHTHTAVARQRMHIAENG